MASTTWRENVLDRINTKLVDFKRRRITNAADAVDNQDYVTLAQVNALIAGLSKTSSGNVTNNVTNNTTITGNAVIDYHTLTANLTINTASVTPPPADTLLVVILLQDSTGHWTTTFGTDFQISPAAGTLGLLPNTTSVVVFASHSGKWYQVGPPLTNR